MSQFFASGAKVLELQLSISPSNEYSGLTSFKSFPHSSVGKESTCNAGEPGSIPVSRRFLGKGSGIPFQNSCLENPMDRGACQATVHGFARVRHGLATKPPPIPLRLTGLISAVQGTLKSLLQYHINSSGFSPVYGTTLTSIHDYWKKDSFD